MIYYRGYIITPIDYTGIATLRRILYTRLLFRVDELIKRKLVLKIPIFIGMQIMPLFTDFIILQVATCRLLQNATVKNALVEADASTCLISKFLLN